MLAFIKTNLLWTEGHFVVLVLGLFALFALLFCRPLLYVVIGLFLFSLYFFRNPVRVCPEALQDPTVLVCPADGTVVAVEHDNNNGFEGYTHKVSIFLSIFNAHVNWIPTSGVIEQIDYKTGTFSLAFLPKSSLLNERNDILISRADGNTILVRQIAGTIARRICCWVRTGEPVALGQKYGMIRFGSRVDILLPASACVTVKKGQAVFGGQTQLGTWIK